jgi:hypothetical protein
LWLCYQGWNSSRTTPSAGNGTFGGTYDFYSDLNRDDFYSDLNRDGYFGIYQPVKIGGEWKYAAQITSDVGEIFYILWPSLDDFISLLDKWYACINQKKEGDASLEHPVRIVELNSLRIEDNDWVCDSVTDANSSSIHWSNVYQFRSDHSIKRVNCDNVCIQGYNTQGFIYTVKDNDGVTYEFISRTLTVNKNENDKCILPIQLYWNNDAGYCVPFVITGFAGASSRVKVENVGTLSGGVNSFDVHATQNLYHQYYVPYSHSARLYEKYHQYEGDFDQYYKVNTKTFDVKAPDINVETTDINVEATKSHIKTTQHKVGHFPYVNKPHENLVSFSGVVIQPVIHRPEMFDDFEQNLEYDLYIPLCEMTVNNEDGYASVYKMQSSLASKAPKYLVLWTNQEGIIDSFYRTYYKIHSTNPIAVPELTGADFVRNHITVFESYLCEPPFNSIDLSAVSSQEPFMLYGMKSTSAQKSFVREEVSIYTDRIEWIERDPRMHPQRRFTINLSPDEIVSNMSDGNGGFIIAKYTGETKSQDPSKYAIIMYGNIRQAQPSYENLGETYLYDSRFTDFKNIYKYDDGGQDSFNKVLIIDRADTALPATNSSCETWQEKVYTRGLEIKNDCSEYSVYCNQFFVNGIDIVPLLPKLQELVSSSNS